MNSFYSCNPLWKEYPDLIDLRLFKSLPVKLIESLQGKKEASYNHGFLSIVSPRRFQYLFELWNLDPKTCFPFIKSAFGIIIFYHQDEYKILNPVYNYIDVIAGKDDFDFLMDFILCDKEGLHNSLLMDSYFQVVDNIGPPELEECYAFVPALGLGGSKEVSNISKVKMKEEMILLSQL